MSATEPLMIEVNARDMESLRAKLGPELYREGIGRAITDLVHLAEGEIKGRTPFVTGNLRRSIMSDVADAMREAGPEGRVAADETMAVYAWWIETGENRRGHRMKTKPGARLPAWRGLGEPTDRVVVIAATPQSARLYRSCCLPSMS